MRDYTLQTARDKIVHHNQVNIHGGLVSSEISLHHLYLRLMLGQSLPEIRADFPQMKRSRLLLARAFFYASNPDAYQNRATQNLKVLVDENVDEHVVTDTARRAFGRATHVSFEGLADNKDIDLWKFAVKNNFNLIVSKDRARIRSRSTMDLTLCAETSWHYRLKANGWGMTSSMERLPRILHIMDGSLVGQDIANLLIKHKSKIFELFEEASSPSIQVSRDLVKPGKNILEIAAEGQFEKLRDQRDSVVQVLLKDYGIESAIVDLESKQERQLLHDIATQLKRIAEHEMLEQLILKKGHMISDANLIRRVKQIVPPVVGDVSDEEVEAYKLIIADYKNRGIGSVMAPDNRVLAIA